MLILKLSKKMWKKNLRCFRSVWYCCCCWYCFCLDACGVRPNALFGSGFKGKRLIELYNEHVLRWKNRSFHSGNNQNLKWTTLVYRFYSSERFYWIWIWKHSLWAISAFMISFKGIYNFKIAHFFLFWLRPSRTWTWTRSHPLWGTDCDSRFKRSNFVNQVSDCADVFRYIGRRISANNSKF